MRVAISAGGWAAAQRLAVAATRRFEAVANGRLGAGINFEHAES